MPPQRILFRGGFLFVLCVYVCVFPVFLIPISSGSNFYFPFGDTFYPEFPFNDLGFVICFMILSCLFQYTNEVILGLTRSFQHTLRTCWLASFIE